jgi:hypothetical protein
MTYQKDAGFQEQATRAMHDKFAVPAPMKRLAQLLTEQEADAYPVHGELSADGRRLKENFERDGIVLGESASAATEAITRGWVPTRDVSQDVFRERLHFFGADRAGTGGPWVYSLTWGVIEGGTGGAGIGIIANVREGELSASHFTHGSNQLSAYSGIGMVIVPGLERCTLSVRPVVNWRGFDILSHRVFDPQLDPKGWGVAGAQLGLHVQSWDLAGGTFRDDGGKWVSLLQRSEINPSGPRYYNDTVDARDLQTDVLAASGRKYVIWVSCRALVITQAKFDLDIWASASVSCQIPYVVVEEMVI